MNIEEYQQKKASLLNQLDELENHMRRDYVAPDIGGTIFSISDWEDGYIVLFSNIKYISPFNESHKIVDQAGLIVDITPGGILVILGTPIEVRSYMRENNLKADFSGLFNHIYALKLELAECENISSIFSQLIYYPEIESSLDE